MCGVAGFYNFDLSESQLEKATNTLAHRGPDHSAIYYNSQQKVGLGHRRLSIIDLSVHANQPMFSYNKRYVAVFNGEIYNFKSIAKKLNLNCRTTSDTEVVIEAFAKLGPSFAEELNGMFAIAIYDTAENELFLFRDRMGIKPLYYYQKDNALIFASELKGIQTLFSKEELTYNQSAIYNFLHLGYIPKEQTVYQEVNKLAAGHFLQINQNGVKLNPFWKLEEKYQKETIKDEAVAKKQLDTLLNNAVSDRLISDVPLGTFLSGGIDSSLVTAIASKHATGKLNTFSIGFKEQQHNESIYAQKVASVLGTNHHEFMLSETEAKEHLETIISGYDQPFADSSALPTFLVSQIAKKQVTVALSGDGGDELFMGYGAYNWRRRLNNPFIWNSRSLLSAGLKLGNNQLKRAAGVINTPNNGIASHIFSQEQYLFSEKELQRLIKNSKGKFQWNLPPLARKLSAVEEQTLFDLKNYLKDDLLVKVDIASMMNSLEVRVPLLDHNVVEFALNIDEKLKFHPNGTQKHILKEVLYHYVPKELFNRPKWGFSIPLKQWLKTDLKYLIDNYLNEQVIHELHVLEWPEVKALITRFEKGEDYLYNRLWAMIVLNKFLLSNNNS